MPAYVVFLRERTRDPDALKIYGQKARRTLEGHTVKRLVAYGACEVKEGAETEGVVILEFPTMDAAKAWYDGEAYKAAREWRFKAADYRCMIVEGL